MFDWDEDQEELVGASSVLLAKSASAHPTSKRRAFLTRPRTVVASLLVAGGAAVFAFAPLPSPGDGAVAAGFASLTAPEASMRQAIMPEVLLVYSPAQAGEFLQRIQRMSDADLLTFEQECSDAITNNLSGGLLANYWTDASALSAAEIERRQLSRADTGQSGTL